MIFCTKCGRQRTGSSRFCDGCGNDLGEQAVDTGTPLASEPVAQPRGDASANATRVDTPDAAQPPTGPDPFAPWFGVSSPAYEAAPPSVSPADRWDTADTVTARQTPAPQYQAPQYQASQYQASQYQAPQYQAPQYQAQGYPPPEYPPPSGPGSPERRSGGGRRAAFIIVVVLVALATGGGAYAIVAKSTHHTTAQPSSAPTITAPANTAPANTATPVAQPSNAPTAPASVQPSTAPPPPSPTPSPTQTGTVQVAAGVGSNPAAPQVQAFLNEYFKSINTRNYGEYNSLLDAQKQQSDSQSTFDSGYATTKDANEVLTGITDTGGGSLTANVSFTSQQSPADSIDQSPCNDWQISLYLVPQGAGYVMTAAPAGYTASYTDC
jgi:hypothetical protein